MQQNLFSDEPRLCARVELRVFQRHTHKVFLVGDRIAQIDDAALRP